MKLFLAASNLGLVLIAAAMVFGADFKAALPATGKELQYAAGAIVLGLAIVVLAIRERNDES